ncbi:MAG TPA: hypothetical protein VF988_03380 [Verrucomicrobiae bacterium]
MDDMNTLKKPSPIAALLPWMENGVTVSTNRLSANNNRSIPANFDAPLSVTLAAYPIPAGAVSGAGAYPARASVTVISQPPEGRSAELVAAEVTRLKLRGYEILI